MNEGPRPMVAFLVLLGCIILLGAVFAIIKLLVQSPSGVAQEQGSVEVTFCPGQCDEVLIAALASAKSSECVFYDLNYQPIALALVNTTTGIFDENANKTNITVTSIPSRGLMHHKFCVINGTTVVTGSMNPTMTDVERNDNNLLVIHSVTLAKRYDTEFDDLVGRRGATYTKHTSPTSVNLSGHQIQLRMCPQENCEAAVVAALGKAQHEILFMTFSFTSDPIGDALLAASERNITVRGVFEKRQIDKWSEYHALQAAGLDVLLEQSGATMHNKVFIIDNRTVITGSYNPTASAQERNDENLLIIDDPVLASQYRQRFQEILQRIATS
jgi:phosphatidylserine/phosphatidylglycerophosphate/cardiolipin synthase-like enzyme